MQGQTRAFLPGPRFLVCIAGVLLLLAVMAGCSNEDVTAPVPVTVKQDCSKCHKTIAVQWNASKHSATQLDVAGELAGERAGETPEEVLHGADAENCIACHGARSVLTGDGMSEAEALGYFFTTTEGVFTGATELDHTQDWPHVTCETCHDVPDSHPEGLPTLGIFDSSIAMSVALDKRSALCGQCHGSLKFSDTDHLTFDAWEQSGHADTQDDVADELAEERAGESPNEVVTGEDPENCIACHGPTAVLANGGMSEVAALDYFFTTSGGTFSSGTTADHADQWPGVECVACHDPHNPDGRSYFNSATGQYEPMDSVNELCGQCHGNLRFAATDHRSYNMLQGTDGIGIPDGQLMGDISCADCHMFASGEDDTYSTMYHGHSFAITVTEEDGSTTTSCTHCHFDMDTVAAEAQITEFQDEYAALLTTATDNVDAATDALTGSSDQDLLDKLDEAQGNLDFAASDESGGFHNHPYAMALLNDANTQALDILGSR